MNPREEERIVKWNDRLSGEVRIHVLLGEDEQGAAIQEYCTRLSHLAPKIRVTTIPASPSRDVVVPAPPSRDSAIQIRENLLFKALPLGTELEPFLDALALQVGGLELDPARRSEGPPDLPALPAAEGPVEPPPPMFIKLYVAGQCSFCPVITRRLVPLTAAHPWIHLTVLDGVLFHEQAKEDKIQAVPTVIINDCFRWTGSLSVEEILEVIANRDPAELSTAVLENMIQEGGATTLARMMGERGSVFPRLIALLTDETWSSRLGAMVVFEELVEHDPPLAKQCMDPLWQLFPGLNDTVMGDVLYLIGKAGGARSAERLKAILAGSHSEEVMEAAQDALKNIEARGADQ